MTHQLHTEFLIEGLWCCGTVWDWEEHLDGWWAVVSAHPQVGKTDIGRVPDSHVRELSPSAPRVPRTRRTTAPVSRLSFGLQDTERGRHPNADLEAERTGPRLEAQSA
jgi:hypothetical protein